jgi:ABC-type multidrug transport system fused ATPase/permease subunit
MHAMEMLPQEKSMVTSPEHKVDSSWPRKGKLDFSDVKMRYRPELPLALNGLTFTLEHGQRCAVVGRTGAGKSSITSALFRLVEIESGSILKSLELVRFPGASKYSILEDIVEEGGGNFSAGEKQLLCLARAMLARPRLLVLDEATSSVDLATDEFVQKMLRSQFSDTTLLTIAHR